MSSLYAWLARSEVEELATLYLNHLSLGQYELARAAFQQLSSAYPTQAREVAATLLSVLTNWQVLKNIITKGPPQEWIRSVAVPSSAHLLWCCYVDYLRLTKAKVASFLSLLIPGHTV
jgi:hypothetical protein